MKKTLISSFILFVTLSFCFAQQHDERKVSHFTAVKSGGSFDVILKKGQEEKVVIEAQSGPIDKIITEVDGDVLKIYVDDHFNNYHFRNVNIYITFRELNEISGSGSGTVKLESPLQSSHVYLASSGSGSLYCNADISSESDVKISNSGSGSCKIESSITAKRGTDIHNSGSGNVYIRNLSSDDLSVNNSGSGSMRIDGGRTEDQSVVLSGSGSYYAAELESSECDIRKSGSGSVHINVKNMLSGNSSGSGDIYMKGTTARMDFHTSGSGRIKTID